MASTVMMAKKRDNDNVCRICNKCERTSPKAPDYRTCLPSYTRPPVLPSLIIQAGQNKLVAVTNARAQYSDANSSFCCDITHMVAYILM